MCCLCSLLKINALHCSVDPTMLNVINGQAGFNGEFLFRDLLVYILFSYGK